MSAESDSLQQKICPLLGTIAVMYAVFTPDLQLTHWPLRNLNEMLNIQFF